MGENGNRPEINYIEEKVKARGDDDAEMVDNSELPQHEVDGSNNTNQTEHTIDAKSRTHTWT